MTAIGEPWTNSFSVRWSGKSNGGTYNFNPSVSRQRAGLLRAANGNIYAGFASFCDINANLSAAGFWDGNPGQDRLRWRSIVACAAEGPARGHETISCARSTDMPSECVISSNPG